MSYRIWWRWNDGVSGHVWLSASDAQQLADEMALQGCAALADRITSTTEETTITPQEVTIALEGIEPIPVGAVAAELWEDWVRFLEAAEVKGGLLVRR